jgi:UDP-glucose 4-epimerase
MRVVVTGGAGFVGSHIVDRLVKRGDSVLVVDDLSTGLRENVAGDVELLRADASFPIADYRDADAIVHCAAYADLRHNWDHPREREALYRKNVDVTRAVLEHVSPKATLIFLSTASVYGSGGGTGVNGACREDDAKPTTCESPYAASKLACEALVASYGHARRFRWRILRLVNVVGARTAHGVIGDFVRMAKAGAIHAADNGRQRKSWVNVADVADVVARLLEADVPRDTYNVTSRVRVSWWEIVDLMGIDRELVTFEDRAGGAVGDPVNLNVSGERLAPYFAPSRSIASGIQEALAHLGWQQPKRAA